MPEYRVYVDHLRIGVFIRLDLRWYEHPFVFGSFKIRDEDQIETLKQLGIKTVICVPEKSDQLPKPPSLRSPLSSEKETQQEEQGDKPSAESLFELKKERIKRQKDQRRKSDLCETRFEHTLERVKNVMKNLGTASEEVVKEADSVVREMAGVFLSEADVAIHLMNTKAGSEDVFYHSLNTAVLAMILGRECGLDAEAMQMLGMGMLFHDVGKHRLTKQILYKQTPLTPPELKMLQLHPQYGAEIMSKMKDFPAGAIEIIRKHHETENGKGYPDGLSGKDIPLLVKIAGIVDVYDNHCNKLDPATSLTPSQAISYMFGKQKNQFDPGLLPRFIRCLGVYPPGTIALLSNESLGIVVAVNSKNLLRPSLLLYDPDIPKNEALVVDLDDEPDLKIVKSIHPGKLPQKVFDYLSPRTRVTYFAKSTADTQ